MNAIPPKTRSRPNHSAKRSSSPSPFISSRMRVCGPTHGPTNASASLIDVDFSAQITQSADPISAAVRAIDGAPSAKSPIGLVQRSPPDRTAS